MNDSITCSATPRGLPSYEIPTCSVASSCVSICQAPLKQSLLRSRVRWLERTAQLPHLLLTAATLAMGRCHGIAGTGPPPSLCFAADRSSSGQICFARLTASAMPRCTRRLRHCVAPWDQLHFAPALCCSRRGLAGPRCTPASTHFVQTVRSLDRLTLARTALSGVCHPFFSVSARG